MIKEKEEAVAGKDKELEDVRGKVKKGECEAVCFNII